MSSFPKGNEVVDCYGEAQLVMQEYESVRTQELQAQLQYMEKWASENTNTPLLLLGDSEAGKKALICSFLKQHKKSQPNWLHISHFASLTPNYAHILYQITVQLRKHFKIEQRVELNEEKLRRYFKYWLQIVSSHLEREYLGYSPEDIPKVMIMIEGIDECTDARGHPVDPTFWLPSGLPNNVRLVFSATSVEPGTAPQATILHHHLSQTQRNNILQSISSTAKAIVSKNPDFNVYTLKVIDRMTLNQPQFAPKSSNMKSIIEEYIDHVSEKGLEVQKIKSLLYLLTLTRKGLMQNWLSRIVTLTPEKWQKFRQCFGLFVAELKDHMIICNRGLRDLIAEIVDPLGEKKRVYRLEIAHAIRKEGGGLEEMVSQLLQGQHFTQLKEVICRVENFLSLYTPVCKHLLCQCWVKLENVEQYDPVFEYNRAIESFNSHYYPKEEDLFRIIFQLCMFFKEYAEFENAKTPQFRHPLIKGQVDFLEDIGIFEDLKALNMVGKNKSYKMKPLDKGSDLIQKERSSTRRKKERDAKKAEEGLITHRTLQSSSKRRQANASCESFEEENERPSTVNERQSIDTELINVEELNVTIAANQEKFRQFFIGGMKDYLGQYFVPLKKSMQNQKELSWVAQQSDAEEDTSSYRDKNNVQREFRFDVQRMKEGLSLKRFKEYMEESFHMTGQSVSNYYYKQWIWLQFPWICQTVKHDYSQLIKECIPGSIHFMSPDKEAILIRDVIKVASSHKQSKTGIYNNTHIQVLPLNANKKDSLKLKTNEVDAPQTKRNRPNVKVNMDEIDEYIVKEKEIQQNYKDKYGHESRILKGQASLPSLGPFVTQTAHKEQSRVFPSIGKSKYMSSVRAGKENSHEDSRDYTLIIRKLNEIKHENDMLVGKIEEIRKVNSMQVDRSKDQKQKVARHIKELETRQSQLGKTFSDQQELKKKLDLIIKVCDLNKMYGSESEHLSSYLNSIKDMTNLEESRTKALRQGIYSTLESSRQAVKELRLKKKQLKSAKEESMKPVEGLDLDTSLQNYPTIMEEEEEDLFKTTKMTRTHRKRQATKKEVYLQNQNYRLLEQNLGIVFEDETNQQKIQSFEFKIQKIKELSAANAEMQRQIQKKLQRQNFKDFALQSGTTSNKNERALKAGSDTIDKKRELSLLRQRKALLSHALTTIPSPN